MDAILENLKAARKLLSDPKHWTKGAMARNENGEKCGIYDKNVLCFCTIGAVHKTGEEALLSDVYKTTYYLQQYLKSTDFKLDFVDPWSSVAAWNDDPALTHEKMLEILDGAIAAYPYT